MRAAGRDVAHLQHGPNRPEDVLKVDADEEGNGGDDTADCPFPTSRMAVHDVIPRLATQEHLEHRQAHQQRVPKKMAVQAQSSSVVRPSVSRLPPFLGPMFLRLLSLCRF